MKNYKKKMKRTIRMEAAGRGLLTGALISLGIILLLWAGKMNLNEIYTLIITLAVCAVCAGAAVLLSLFRTSALNSRIRSLERISGDMNNDMIVSVSPDTAIGERWLVNRRGTKYRFWTKDMIRSISFNSSNPQAKKTVMEITDQNGHTEKVIVTRSEELQLRAEEWMRPEPDIVF